jgi:hypothetical protein
MIKLLLQGTLFTYLDVGYNDMANVGMLLNSKAALPNVGSTLITNGGHFSFGMKDIVRIRQEMMTFIERLSFLYQEAEEEVVEMVEIEEDQRILRKSAIRAKKEQRVKKEMERKQKQEPEADKLAMATLSRKREKLRKQKSELARNRNTLRLQEEIKVSQALSIANNQNKLVAVCPTTLSDPGDIVSVYLTNTQANSGEQNGSAYPAQSMGKRAYNLRPSTTRTRDRAI